MATIGKKFLDPDKWEAGWWTRLSQGQKLLYTYIWERCDHAGAIEFVPQIFSAHIGQQIDAESLQKLADAVNTDCERIVIYSSNLIWLTEYLRFNQQGDPNKSLSPDYSFHKHVARIIQQRGLVDEIIKRDPILLSKFENLSKEESTNNKACPTLKQALPKPTSRGKSGSGGEAPPSSLEVTEDEFIKNFEFGAK